MTTGHHHVMPTRPADHQPMPVGLKVVGLKADHHSLKVALYDLVSSVLKKYHQMNTDSFNRIEMILGGILEQPDLLWT
jgi:hypothetical protein